MDMDNSAVSMGGGGGVKVEEGIRGINCNGKNTIENKLLNIIRHQNNLKIHKNKINTHLEVFMPFRPSFVLAPLHYDSSREGKI